MPAEAVSATAPLASAHRDPLVTCSDVSLPVLVRIWLRYTDLMLSADRIVAHLGHRVSPAGEACLAQGECGVADQASAVRKRARDGVRAQSIRRAEKCIEQKNASDQRALSRTNQRSIDCLLATLISHRITARRQYVWGRSSWPSGLPGSLAACWCGETGKRCDPSNHWALPLWVRIPSPAPSLLY
jgi:hypothetical protein